MNVVPKQLGIMGPPKRPPKPPPRPTKGPFAGITRSVSFAGPPGTELHRHERHQPPHHIHSFSDEQRRPPEPPLRKSSSTTNLSQKSQKGSPCDNIQKNRRSTPVTANIHRSSSLRNLLHFSGNENVNSPVGLVKVDPPRVPERRNPKDWTSNNLRKESFGYRRARSLGPTDMDRVDIQYHMNTKDSSGQASQLEIDVLSAWLDGINFEEYLSLFVNAGYDLPTISRMNPEDLTAVGVQKPGHRKRLIEEISKLKISDGIPDFIPESLQQWIHLLRLDDYIPKLAAQGYSNIEQVAKINIEDLEDAGFVRLGHQKRLILAIKKLKELQRRETITKRKQILSLKDFSTFRTPTSDNIMPYNQKEDSSKFVSSKKSSLPLLNRRIICNDEESNQVTNENTFLKPPFSGKNRTTFEVKENKQQINSLSCNSSFNNFKSNTLPRFKHNSSNKYRPVATVRANTRSPVADEVEEKSKKKDRTSNLTTTHNTILLKSTSMSKLSTKPPSKRTAGDVFEDIGTMLSDLTKELDEMIKSEENEEDQECQMFSLDKDNNKKLEETISLNDGEGWTMM